MKIDSGFGQCEHASLIVNFFIITLIYISKYFWLFNKMKIERVYGKYYRGFIKLKYLYYKIFENDQKF